MVGGGTDDLTTRETVEVESMRLALSLSSSSSADWSEVELVHLVMRTDPFSGSPSAGQLIIWHLGVSSLH